MGNSILLKISSVLFMRQR